MKVHRAAYVTIILSLLAPSPNKFCCGFSANNKPNKRRKKIEFTAKIVEDAVVRDVTSKIAPQRGQNDSKKSTLSKPLNARQRSFTQRDPIISLNMNIDYLSKSGQRGAAKRCEELLLRIEALHDDGYYEKAPDVVSYNSCLNAYAHGRRSGNSKVSRSGNAKRLMNRMKEKGLKPNTITWNILLRCILKDIGDNHHGNSPEEKVQEAESILNDMEHSGLANTISYNTIISIISKSGLHDAAERAEKWLQRLLDLYESTQNEKIQPDACSFNSVIHSLANIKYNTAGATDRAQKAEEVIRVMERMHTSGENDNVKPDVYSYTGVLNAYSRAASQDESCAFKALEILEHMEELHEQGDEDVKPNKRTYTAVINGFARIGKPEVADDLLSKMKKNYQKGDKRLKPDTICYSSIIDGYARKGGEESAFRAEELLREMEDRYNNNGDVDVKPNGHVYRAVISALAKSGQSRAAEKAEQILDEMTYISQHSPAARDLAPNTIIYNSVLNAFAKSKSVSKAYRAELLLERMLEETAKGNVSIRPDVISFNSVINAAATSTFGDATVRKEAFMIGLNAFRQVHSLDYCRPSSITYVTYLKLLRTLVKRGANRDSMAERVYGICNSLGLANDAVRTQLRKTCSPLIAQRILSSSNDTQQQ